MGKIKASLLFLSLLSIVPTHAHADAPWNEMVTSIGLPSEKATMAADRWRDGGLYILSMVSNLSDDWRLIDSTTISTGKKFSDSSGSLYKMDLVAAEMIDAKSAVGPKPEWSPSSRTNGKKALVTAIMDLQKFLNKPLTYAEISDLKAKVSTVPSNVALAAAVIMKAVPDSIKKRDQAFEGFGGPDTLPTAYKKAVALGIKYDVDADTLRLMDKIDMNSLIDGSLIVARVVDKAPAYLKSSNDKDFAFTWETPIGKIALNGKKANVYDGGPYILIIDTGGNDTYKTAASATYAVPVSVCIDFAGDDKYETTEQGAIGCGILGYSFLVDCAGNDTYKTVVAGLGTGIFGVGILMDRSGNDVYDCREAGEGMGAFGVGIVNDLAGDDKYYCFHMAQGYGGTKGCGAVIDSEGKDLYEANDKQIDYVSSQTTEHNESLAQGCGVGRRAHPGDGHSLAGGLGILVDVKGDDAYKGGVFSQGVGYWYALGMLVDMSGNDSYNGVWYAQGAAAHYAVGSLCDLAGNDRYVSALIQCQGHGRDYSIGWLHDLRGNDYYECYGWALGSSNMNGIGIFWDEAGNDEYKSGLQSFGYGGESRPGQLCLGLFFDQGGLNKFSSGDNLAKQGAMWKQDPIPGKQCYGVGLSR